MNIIKRVLNKINRIYERYLYKIELSRLIKLLLKSNNKSRIILFQTPSHTNIGDHAIADAEIQFLKKEFPDYDLIEVNQLYHFDVLQRVKGKLPTSDIITLHGGGNLGNQYMYEEKIRRSTIASFPNNKIILFPQTIYYTKDDMGRRELSITQELFAKHTDLTLIAREKVSFDLMQTYFPHNNILLTPDIVLSMNIVEPKVKRDGILMVLRADGEKILDDNIARKLDEIVHNRSSKIIYSDMHYHKNVIDAQERNEMLDFKFQQFKGAKLVITDRLHGMVFSAITGTPCIAFSNYNQKVSGTYEWIKHLNYIRFIDQYDDLEKEIDQLLNLDKIDKYDVGIFNTMYSQLVNTINN